MTGEYFRIVVPEMEVEVGTSQTVTITIINITAFLIKEIQTKSDILDSELWGVVPEKLQAGESFNMQLTLSPKEWNPNGMGGTIYVAAKMVSR